MKRRPSRSRRAPEEWRQLARFERLLGEPDSPQFTSTGGGAMTRTPTTGTAPRATKPPPQRAAWGATAERMRRIAATHADPKVRAYAAEWLETRELGEEGQGP